MIVGVWRCCWSAATILALSTLTRAEASSIYNFTALTAPNSNQPQIYGMNNQGQVLGINWNGPTGATTFLYDPQAGGKVSNLSVETNAPLPIGSFIPQNFNNNGQMIGYQEVGVGQAQAVLASSGSYTNLPGYPRVINDNGDVGGWASAPNGQDVTSASTFSGTTSQPLHSYITSQGVTRDIGTVPGFASSWIIGLNNSDQAAVAVSSQSLSVVQAAYYDGHTLKDLGTLGGAESNVVGINNKGDVIGYSDLTHQLGQDGFISHQGGPLIDIGRLPNSSLSMPASINDQGQVVGTATLNSGGSTGFLYQQGALTDLNTLLPSTSNLHVTEALAINNTGQILVEGTLKNVGWPQLFLLTPEGQPIPASPDPLIQITPEPGTWAIFGLLAVTLVFPRRSPRR